MKEVKHYICEICGTEYNDRRKCQECEKTHCKVAKIVSARYIRYGDNKKGYPVSITVEMENGEKVEYKR